MHKYATVEEYLSAQPQPLCDIGLTVAGQISAGLPEAEATLWHGHPTWRVGKVPVCLLKAYTRHLTLGFWRGATFDDPTGRLVPSGGQEMASVKLRVPEDIDAELFAGWVAEARSRALAT